MSQVDGAFVEVRPGVGGDEAQAWAQMMARMYTRFAERRGWECDVIDDSPTQLGTDGVVLMVRGEGAHEVLVGEQGVHRLVRVPPWSDRRHMSVALVRVLPMSDAAVLEGVEASTCAWLGMERMLEQGQAINMKDPGVELRHRETGFVARSRHARSQRVNRQVAMSLLAARVGGKDEHYGYMVRSVVLDPYERVEDPRTGYETEDARAVLDGALDGVVKSWKAWSVSRG